mgnify:CR=1 FL=1
MRLTMTSISHGNCVEPSLGDLALQLRQPYSLSSIDPISQMVESIDVEMHGCHCGVWCVVV